MWQVRRLRLARTILFLLTAMLLCPFAQGKVIYVDDDAAGANDGTSWASAYVYLQDALVDANDSAKPVEIRVAQGVYKPDRGADRIAGNREATFQLINGVNFQGTVFTGVFDGKGHTISHLTITGKDYVGLFGQLGSGAQVKDLGVVDVKIAASGSSVGGLVGSNGSWNVPGGSAVRGQIGVGGLVGINYVTATHCYATGAVTGGSEVGGLAGDNYDTVTQCYSTGLVSGTGWTVGGLVGYKSESYGWWTGSSFWDTQTSGQATSAGGAGKTTAEMQTAGIFLEAGWDFVDETANGTEDIWWIDEGKDYPRLWWELGDEASR